jgi:hypothetical protein
MGRISDIDESRRQLLLGMLSSGLLVSNPVMSAQLSRVPHKLAPGQFTYKLLGDVRVNGLAVTLSTQLKAGDTITTGDRSFVIFVFEADAFIVRSNSEMTVRPGPSTSVSAPQNKPVETKSTEIKRKPLLSAYALKRGKVLSVMASGNTEITTPSAVISIRGTGVYVEAEPDESYVCVCYGETDIQSTTDPSVKEEVITQHHDAPKFVTGGNNPRILPAPFENHDDEELLLIETLVGRTTPYFVPGGISRSRNNYF